MAKEEDGGFLKRWSNRKLSGEEEMREGEAAAEPQPASAPDPEAEEARRKAQEEYLRSLPDPESLDYDSDFTLFLKEGVPQELQTRALRRLWRSNPALANLDGLIDYGGDYTNAGVGAGIVKTIYKVGRGMIRDEEERESEKTAGREPEQRPESLSSGEPAQAGQDLSSEFEPAREDGSLQAKSTDDQEEEGTEQEPESRPRQPKGTALARRWGAVTTES